MLERSLHKREEILLCASDSAGVCQKMRLVGVNRVQEQGTGAIDFIPA